MQTQLRKAGPLPLHDMSVMAAQYRARQLPVATAATRWDFRVSRPWTSSCCIVPD